MPRTTHSKSVTSHRAKVLEHQVSAGLSGRLSVTLDGSVSRSMPGYSQPHAAGLGKGDPMGGAQAGLAESRGPQADQGVI